MFQGYQRFHYGTSNQRMQSSRQTNTSITPEWKVIRGKVLSSRNSSDIFRGNEILEVSVVDASLMDAPSTLLGRQKILLQPGQQFPVRFQFYYDNSRAGRGYGGLMMQARITTRSGQLVYINDTSTPVKDNVKIDVKRI